MRKETITDLFARFAGKKFVGLMAGLVFVLGAVEMYLDCCGDKASPAEVAAIFQTAMIAVGMCVAGSAIGQGIADHGNGARRQELQEAVREKGAVGSATS
ncbi:MAG: hypothetical protein AAF581_15945 [Planctomycetota bacterium]